MIKTVYITKYALTEGVIKAKADVHIPKNFDFRWALRLDERCLLLGDEFFLTEEQAVQYCKGKRDKQIAQLQKSVERLKNLEFNLVK